MVPSPRVCEAAGSGFPFDGTTPSHLLPTTHPPLSLSLSVVAVCRLAKEAKMYKVELGQQEEKISRLKQQGADEYDIKKQVGFSSFFHPV